MSSKTLLTADELELMPDDDSVQIELDEGELITMPPAAEDHGYHEARIARLLGNFVEEPRLGRVYTGDTGFRLSEGTVRAPDVAFVRKARVAEVRSKTFGKGAPDLAVEIFSPSDNVRQLMRKVKQYFAAGCHTVWIVYPDRSEVQILESNGTDRLVERGGVIEAPELLPGFSLPIEQLSISPPERGTPASVSAALCFREMQYWSGAREGTRCLAERSVGGRWRT